MTEKDKRLQELLRTSQVLSQRLAEVQKQIQLHLKVTTTDKCEPAAGEAAPDEPESSP